MKSKTRAQGVAKRYKDLKNDSAKVEKKIDTTPLVTAPSSQDAVNEGVNGRGSVKRNLFGTLPTGLDECAANESNQSSNINFSFHSPVKGGETVAGVSIHESVSSALHQLPPLGDDNTTAINRNNDCYEQACAEDDQWLENVSMSAWEGETDTAKEEMSGANTARVLRRFIIQSVGIRQRMDLEPQATTTIPRYVFYVPSRFTLSCL